MKVLYNGKPLNKGDTIKAFDGTDRVFVRMAFGAIVIVELTDREKAAGYLHDREFYLNVFPGLEIRED